jgi:hypothetical protein
MAVNILAGLEEEKKVNKTTLAQEISNYNLGRSCNSIEEEKAESSNNVLVLSAHEFKVRRVRNSLQNLVEAEYNEKMMDLENLSLKKANSVIVKMVSTPVPTLTKESIYFIGYNSLYSFSAKRVKSSNQLCKIESCAKNECICKENKLAEE